MTKTVLVTGASRGIGRATAEALVGAGHRVFAGARTLEPGDATHPLDVTDDASVAAWFAAARARFGPPDVLVNNAGIGLGGRVEDVDLDAARALLEVNVIGALRCIQHAIGAMDHRGGHIVNVSSEVSFRGTPHKGVYCASKAALDALSDSLRVEIAHRGIAVSLIHPGYIDTDIHDAFRTPAQRAAEPGRAVNTVDDIARAIVDLIDRPRIHRVPSARGRAFIALSQWAPRLVDRFIERKYRKRDRRYY